MKLKKSLLR
uniref:Uncharacterized protein n=1 Tax=Anguilla anguilla TaxID=7936 RepID=A0A0E9RVP4_ANGAN